MSWPQAKEPFTLASLEFIDALDPFQDARMIQKRSQLREKCLRNFIISCLVLKKAAIKNFTLYDIGTILYRSDDDQITVVQSLISKTESYISKVIAQKITLSNNDTEDESLENYPIHHDSYLQENIQEDPISTTLHFMPPNIMMQSQEWMLSNSRYGINPKNDGISNPIYKSCDLNYKEKLDIKDENKIIQT